MADNTIILDIKVSNEDAVLAIQKAQDALTLLKQKEKELNQQWKENSITEQEYAKAMGDCKTSIEEQTTIIKANNDVLKQNVKEQKSAEGSLVALRAQLKQLTTAYDNLSKNERDGAKGTEMLEHIKSVTEELKTAEEASGRFQRNVGNYENSFKAAFSSLNDLKDGLEGVGAQGSAKAVDGLNKVKHGFDALRTNPIGAVITAVVFAATRLSEAFKGDEDAMSSLNDLTKAFQPVLNALKKVFEAVVKVVTKAIQAITKFFNKIVSAIPGLQKFRVEEDKAAASTEKVAEAAEKTTKATTNYADAVKKAAEIERTERQKTADMVIKMMGTQRDLIDAEADKQIADINRRLAEEKNLTLDARKELNTQIVLLDAQRAIAIANLSSSEMMEQQRIREEIIKARLANVKDDADKEMALRQQLLVQQTNMAKAALDDRLMSEKLTQEQYEALIKELKTKTVADELEIERQRNASILAEIELGLQQELEAYTAGSIERMNAEVQLRKNELDAVHQMEYESEEAFLQRKMELQNRYDTSVAASATKQVSINKAKAEGIASITNSLSATMEAAAGDNEDLVKASKVVALAEVAIKQGVAIAEAVAGAAAGDPYTYAFRVAAAIASTIAAMTSAISSINSASFATGGLVHGPGTGTSDSIRANVSNGEFIVNAAATKKNLATLVAINGGWGNTTNIPKYAQGGMVGYDSLQASQTMADQQSMIIDAVENIQPIVSVREITKVQNKIIAKERVSRS